jgi:hypothetical protein
VYWTLRAAWPRISGGATSFAFTVDAPAADAQVSQTQGVHAAGTVSGLAADQTLWLLDYDGQTYTPDQVAVVENGTWTAVSAPIGDAGDALPFRPQWCS